MKTKTGCTANGAGRQIASLSTRSCKSTENSVTAQSGETGGRRTRAETTIMPGCAAKVAQEEGEGMCETESRGQQTHGVRGMPFLSPELW